MPTIPNFINTNAEFNKRKNIILKKIKTKLNNTYFNKEVVIAKKSLFNKIKLDFKSFKSELSFIYIKYNGIIKRKFL